MFERFTDRARRVVVLAQMEARRLNHNHIGTEHLLLGLVGDGQGVAAHLLADAGITLEALRAEVFEAVGPGQRPQSGHIPLTPGTKKILEYALRESLELGLDHIGTEHLLLGLIREGEGIGAQLLGRLGGGLETVRTAVLAFIAQQSSNPESASAGAPREGAGGRSERGGPASGPGGPPRDAGQRRPCCAACSNGGRAPCPSCANTFPARPVRRSAGRARCWRSGADAAAAGPAQPSPADYALIIGPTGSGKTALLLAATRAVVVGCGPASLAQAELVELDGPVLRAGVERLLRRTVAAIVLARISTRCRRRRTRRGPTSARRRWPRPRSPLALTVTTTRTGGSRTHIRCWPGDSPRFDWTGRTRLSPAKSSWRSVRNSRCSTTS